MKLTKIAAQMIADAKRMPIQSHKRRLLRGLALSLMYFPTFNDTYAWCLKVGRQGAVPSDQEISIIWDAFGIPAGATMSNPHNIRGWRVVGIDWIEPPEQPALFEMPAEREMVSAYAD